MRGGFVGDGSRIPACNASTSRGEHPAGQSKGDEGATPSPGGKRSLAASDLADASQESRWQRGCSFAEFWWATRNTRCQWSRWASVQVRRFRKRQKRIGCKCRGTLPRQREKIGGRNPVLESSSHLGGACRSLGKNVSLSHLMVSLDLESSSLCWASQ